MKKFTNRIISVFIMLTFIMATLSALTINVSATVDTDATSSLVYAGPSSTTYKDIGKVYNERVTVCWREGDYVYICYKITGTPYSKLGYVHISVVKNYNVPTMSPFSKTTRISTVSQNVYANWADRNAYTSIGSISQGEEVYKLTELNNMTFIEYRVDNTSLWKRGWVPTNTLKEKTATSTIYGAEGAITWARKQLGSNKWDGWCLKFVADAYNPQGVSIGSYSNAKLCANGKTKYYNFDAPYGALVFFDYIAPPPDGRNLGHIGISLGDGTFIHATTGKGVIISTLKGYSDSRYLGWSYPSN